MPFDCLSSDTTKGYGGNSLVHSITSSIVLKTPRDYMPGVCNGLPIQDGNPTATENVAEEKTWYLLLDANPHPHILQSFMSTTEGIWLPQVQTDLKHLIFEDDRKPKDPQEIDRKSKYRWMKELSAAAASLESLKLAHCDIRPSNVLIDNHDQVKLADFDTMTRYGEVPSLPVAPPWVWYDPCCAPKHDIFGIGDTLWEVFAATEYDWGTPEKPKFIPEAIGNEMGDVILRCWKAEYPTVLELAKELESRYLDNSYGVFAPIMRVFPFLPKFVGEKTARVLHETELASGRATIEKFLIDQGASSEEKSKLYS